MEISELQATLRRTYYQRDARRGRDATFRWLTEEVGELAKALRRGDQDELELEFSDVLAWLTSLANLTGVDLERAASRYIRPRSPHLNGKVERSHRIDIPYLGRAAAADQPGTRHRVVGRSKRTPHHEPAPGRARPGGRV